MSRVGWYLKRIRVMTPRELLFRVGQQCTLLSLFGQYKLGAGVAKPMSDSRRFQFCSGSEPQLPSLAFDIGKLQESAETVLKGEIPVAGGTVQWDGSKDIWHRAPDTGRRWPQTFFGSINYREGNQIGDVRQIWEPSRLQQLVDLAMIADTCGAESRQQAIHMVKAQLTSWVESNPPLAGVHYVSAMECALRLIAVCHALDLLRGHSKSDAVWAALVRIVGSHAPLIERRLSLHSSTGNHTVAEAAGLVYAGLLFPEMDGAERWLNKGMEILAGTANTQVLPDGGGVEQSLWYHYFNIQLFSLVNALLKAHGRPATKISGVVERGSRFLGEMGLDTGKLLAIGDGDGGYALSQFLQVDAHTAEQKPRVRTFPEAGYTVARIGSQSVVQLVFDHGPLGMPPAYGHGHADALSLLLRFNNEDVFIDPGTYTYTGEQDWRRYFRGTRAHNTVTVGGMDQATQEGCFLWAKPYRARLVDCKLDGDGGGVLIAEHDGYREAGVRHVRGIAWKPEQWLLVWDGLFGDGLQQLALNWHLAGQPLLHDNEGFDLPVAGGALAVKCSGGTISTHRGEQAPIDGWRSPSYGIIEAITAVRISCHETLPHVFTTLIKLPGHRAAGNEIEDALKWIKERAR